MTLDKHGRLCDGWRYTVITINNSRLFASGLSHDIHLHTMEFEISIRAAVYLTQERDFVDLHHIHCYL